MVELDPYVTSVTSPDSPGLIVIAGELSTYTTWMPTDT
jgi:hypothetical protein